MKTKNLFYFLAIFIASIFNAQVDTFGYTTVNATMSPNYANRVFFDLSENQLTVQPANTWDIAFYRISPQDFGARINDAQNIETYQASNDPTQWDNIDIANLSSWGDPLYNPDTNERLQDGAFSLADPGCSNPAFGFGFGCYNIGNHHIDGKTIFVLKYGDGTYYKFLLTDYYSGYTFQYAKWNGTTWDETITKTIANGTTDAYFNYYSLINNAEVSGLEPATASWDLMFTRYWTFYNNILMYRLSGVIQSPRISVAKETETQETSGVVLPDAADFKNVITTIGHSWKGTTGLIADVVYYIKEDGKYYRLYFTENGGATTGNMTFKYKDITSSLSTNDVQSNVSFGIYPNPAPNKQVTLLYDVKNGNEKDGTISILDMTGKVVYTTEITKQQGFFKKDLQLSNLQAGIYIVALKTGGKIITKKLILK